MAANRFFLSRGASASDIASLWNQNRIVVNLNSYTEAPAYYTGSYDGSLIEQCVAWLEPDSCILDVGANIGFYSVALGSAIRSKAGRGIVLAFEPHPGNFKRLQENVELNQLSSYVRSHQFGLSDSNETLKLVLREDFQNGSTTGNASISTSEQFDKGFERISIEVKPFDEIADDLLPEIARLSFIKVDIEGHEDFFLRGCRKTISTHRPIILTEINPGFLKARNISASELTLDQIPKEYRPWEATKEGLREAIDLNNKTGMRNIFLIPEEKLEQCLSNTVSS